MSYSLNNRLYCNKWEHSNFCMDFCNNGFGAHFFAISWTAKFTQYSSRLINYRCEWILRYLCGMFGNIKGWNFCYHYINFISSSVCEKEKKTYIQLIFPMGYVQVMYCTAAISCISLIMRNSQYVQFSFN